jgi:hypothetical protein
MALERTDKNFDIDAIARLANADANASPMDAVMRNAVPATEQDQPFIDPIAEAFADEANDIADEIKYVPGTNRADEALQLINSTLAAKLPSGVIAGLRAAVQLQEEKAGNNADAFMRGDRVLEEREKREEKERKDKADTAKFGEDFIDTSQLSTTPDKYGMSQRDYGDLNNDLKTRDGQDRMMAFLRMMYPDKTDAQIKERMLDIQAVAAVEDGTANKDQKDRVASKTENEIADLKRDGQQFVKGNGNRVYEVQTAVQSRDATTNVESTGAGQARLEATPAEQSAAITSSVARQYSSDINSFSNATSLRANFADANAATSPLDAQTKPASKIANVQVASVVNSPTGFEV